MSLVEIHMLKNYPPTCLNRDDTGSPKTCMFGAENRARISSQCSKRSYRCSPLFQQEVGLEIAVRTRKLADLVCAKLMEKGDYADFLPVVASKLADFGKGDGKAKQSKKNDDDEANDGKKSTGADKKKQDKSSITKQIIIYSQDDINAIVDMVKGLIDSCDTVAAFEKISTKKDIEEKMKDADTRAITVDIALFGRMVTSPGISNVSASLQVAHAFSTNKVFMESDYFTAVDDLIDGKKEAGSAIIDDCDFNSSCYYLYASLDTNMFNDNMKNTDPSGQVIEKVLPALVKTMAFTNPSGKQNSFAGNVLPSAILVEFKDYPVAVSYANAFAKPVRASYNVDLVTASVERLASFVSQVDKDFCLPVKKRFWFTAGLDSVVKLPVDLVGDTVNCRNFVELIDGVTDLVKSCG